jgi:hypothetical protein
MMMVRLNSYVVLLGAVILSLISLQYTPVVSARSLKASGTSSSHLESISTNSNSKPSTGGIIISEDEYHHYNNKHRHLIEGGKKILYVNTDGKCNDPYGSPCGPESKCIQVNSTAYTCDNEFYYGCVAGCSPNSECTLGSDMVYFCKCIPGYYQPQPWIPCREDRRRK